jgi:hypothetical protein
MELGEWEVVLDLENRLPLEGGWDVVTAID